MTGRVSRSGFYFSDLYLIKILLRELADQQRHLFMTESSDTVEKRYAIESPLDGESESLDWDIVVQDSSKVSVEEVKSGEISKEDRRHFWLRLRSELSKGHSLEILPKLVINSKNKPTSYASWASLAREANAFAGNSFPTEELARVSDGKGLLQEAIWWISEVTEIQRDGKTVALTTTVSRDTCIKVLKDFVLVEIDGESLSLEVESQIRCLFSGVDSKISRQSLIGWLTQIASDPNASLNYFTTQDVVRGISLLSRFVDRPVEVVRLWKAILDSITVNAEVTWDAKGKVVEEINPSKTQPHLSHLFDGRLSRSAVVLGEAGQGKSTFLKQVFLSTSDEKNRKICLRAEDFLSADGSTIDKEYFSAIEFGADISTLEGLSLFVVVDGVDQLSYSARQNLSAGLVRIGVREDIRIVISSRKVDWLNSPKIRELYQGWEECFLLDWSDELVNTILINCDIDRNLSSGLRQLIGNPLYLDLLVRTFGNGAVRVPEGLQTKHGLFKAFWDLKLFGESATASDRRNALSDITNAILIGAQYRIPPRATAVEKTAYEDLTSLGVLVVNLNRGDVHFRHPLIRDFAIGQQLLANVNEMEVRVKNINSPVVRFGSNRAVIEALCEPSSSPYSSKIRIGDYISSLGEFSDDLADVLGTFDDLNIVSIEEWGKSLPESFGPRLLRAATQSKNSRWASVISSFPSDAGWIDQQRWCGKGFLVELISYISVVESVGGAKYLNELKLIATSLRKWTLAIKYTSEMEEYDGWLLARVIPTVVRYAPDAETISWLEHICMKSWRIKNETLDSISILVQKYEFDSSVLDRIAKMYCEIIGLKKVNGNFRINPTWNESVLMREHAIDWNLVGTKSGSGPSLVQLSPSTFLKVALQVAEGLAFEKIRDDQKRFFTRDKKSGEESAVLEGEEDFSFELDPAELIDDSPNYSYWRHVDAGESYFLILKEIHKDAKNAAKQGVEHFGRDYLRALESSRLASIQTQLMQIALDEGGDIFWEEVLKGRLFDGRLYRSSYTQFWLEMAARKLWAKLSNGERDVVLANIFSMSDSDSIAQTDFLIAHFLYQLPREACPKDWLQKVETLESSGKASPFQDPRAERNVQVTSRSIDADEGFSFYDCSWAHPELLEHLRQLNRITHNMHGEQAQQEDEEIVIEGVRLAELIISSLKENFDNLLVNPWPLDQIKVVLSLCRKNNERPKVGRFISISQKAIYDLCDIALAILKVRAPLSSKEEIDASDSYAISGSSEYTVVSLLDKLFIHPVLQENQKYKELFGDVVKEAFLCGGPELQRGLIDVLRPYHWYTTDGRLVAVFETVISEDCLSGAVIKSALYALVGYLPPERAQILIRKIVARDGISSADDVAYEIGRFLGINGLVLYGKSAERHWAAVLCNEWTTSIPNSGLFKTQRAKFEFYMGLSFSLKEAAKQIYRECIFYGDYALWIERIWRFNLANPDAHNSVKEPQRVWLFAIHWIMDSIQSRPEDAEFLKKWWNPLKPIIKQVVAIGLKAEIDMIFREITPTRRGRSDDGTLGVLVSPGWAIDLGETFLGRLGTLTAELTLRDQAKGDWFSWLDVADACAKIVFGAVTHQDSSKSEKESAVKVFEGLAKPPYQIMAAESYLRNTREILERM